MVVVVTDRPAVAVMPHEVVFVRIAGGLLLVRQQPVA
jgi:hypothetical protein